MLKSNLTVLLNSIEKFTNVKSKLWILCFWSKMESLSFSVDGRQLGGASAANRLEACGSSETNGK